MAVKKIAAIDTYSGLRADTKPTAGVAVGALFYETDSGHSYRYDTSAWNLTFPSVDTKAHGAMVTTSHIGHEVHDSHHFTASLLETLTSGSVSSILFETPASAVANIHFILDFGSTGAGTLLFAEGMAGTVGDSIPIYNNNREESGSSEIISLTDTSVGTADTVLENAVLGTAGPPGGIGGQRQGANEWLLQHEMRYSLQFQSSAATTVAWNLFFVEEPA